MVQVNCYILGEQIEEAFPISIPETGTIGHLRSAIKTETSNLFADARHIRLCSVPKGHNFSTSSKTLPLSNIPGLFKIRIAFTNLNDDYVIHALIEPPAAPIPADKISGQPGMTKEPQPLPHRHRRWEELNQVLAMNKKRRLNSADGSYTTAFSYSIWSEVGPIFETDVTIYTENVLPIPEPDLEVLSKVLSWVYKSYSRTLLRGDCEPKRIHLVAPILWSVVQLLPDIRVNIEQDLDGNRVHAHGHFEFVLARGSKRVCIVLAQKEQFQQGLAQSLLGCEVAADLHNIHEVFGIVTNFDKWIFLKSLDDEILMDESNVLSFINGIPDRTQLNFVVGKLHSLLL